MRPWGYVSPPPDRGYGSLSTGSGAHPWVRIIKKNHISFVVTITFVTESEKPLHNSNILLRSGSIKDCLSDTNRSAGWESGTDLSTDETFMENLRYIYLQLYVSNHHSARYGSLVSGVRCRIKSLWKFRLTITFNYRRGV